MNYDFPPFTIATCKPPDSPFLSTATIALSAHGWTLQTERAMAEAALELGPPNVAQLVAIHERSFEEGLLDGARHEQQALEAHLGRDRTALEGILRREIEQAVKIMKTRDPIEHFVYQLGMIAHLTGDLNHPFRLGTGDELESRRSDFEQYLERRRVKFPTVFYGMERDRAVDRVIRKGHARSLSFAPLLHYEYFEKGEERWSRQFDDRSTAFAVASLSWSHTVSDLVNIYYEIWRQAGGDVRKAGLLRPGVVRGGDR
ncbi:MAG: hypothetical protein KY432_01890 [Acidobacteria bacterium]|nr:hypothetical protein [Acidobacteriota bacterium]